MIAQIQLTDRKEQAFAMTCIALFFCWIAWFAISTHLAVDQNEMSADRVAAQFASCFGALEGLFKTKAVRAAGMIAGLISSMILFERTLSRCRYPD